MLTMETVLWRSYYWIFLVMLLFQETFPSSRFIYALNIRRRHFLVTFIVSKIESFYSNKIQTKLHWTPLWKNDVASSTGPDSPV